MHNLFENYKRQNVYFEYGKGSYLYDKDDKEYLDFSCGISVSNLGHSHPHLVGALKNQAEKLWHSSNLYKVELQERLAERIAKASFGGDLFFCNSGAEANECAVKLALFYNNKKYDGKRPRIITMVNGFHGRTYATLSATAQSKVQKGFEPVASFFTYVPYNDISALQVELDKGDVCAVMLELFQGESGVLPVDGVYLEALHKYTRQAGALVIHDEIQTGYGRTGDMFAYQEFGLVPDIMTMAKAIANGVPMGAVEAKHEIAQLFTYGTHGSTFGGNLLACAAANAVLDVMLADGFLDEVKEKGAKFKKMLEDALAPLGASIRGRGFLIGVEMPVSNGAFIEECLKNGLVVIAGGERSVRFYPPLTASIGELEKGIEIARKVLQNLKQG